MVDQPIEARADQCKVTVYHDGGCPMCRVEIRTMRRLDKANKLDFVDITREQSRLDEVGIDVTQAMNRFHVRDDSSGVQTGVQGFLCVYQQLPYLRHLVPVVTRIPGLMPVLEWLYNVFARYRLKLTGREQALQEMVSHETNKS